MMTNQLRIFLWSHNPDLCDLQPILEKAGYEVVQRQLDSVNGEIFSGYDLIVVDGTENPNEGRQLCHTARQRLGDEFLPILYVSGDHSPTGRLTCLESGADSYLLRPFAPGELLSQVQTFAGMKDRHDRLVEKTREANRVNKRLQSAYQQINLELELAARIQESFLPQRLPELPQLRFGVYYRPCGRVGGDFYDVFRLDENHFGFYVADAMGHGVPASLLTIFVKKGIKAKEITGNQYRLVPPGEVLARLNQDMIDQQLSDSPFITMVYVKYNHTEGTLEFSRAGHPHPVHVPVSESVQFCQVVGTLLGVFETNYEVRTVHLAPGDKFLLYTDGVDNATFRDQPKGGASLIACAEVHKKLPVDAFVQRLAEELFGDGQSLDDLTLFAVERVG